MVSKAREDLPEPDTPVTTVKVLWGTSKSMFLRLWARAPRTTMLSDCVGVEDIESGPKATPNPERRRPDASRWPHESFYYKGFGRSCCGGILSRSPHAGCSDVYARMRRARLICVSRSSRPRRNLCELCVKGFYRRARQGTPRSALRTSTLGGVRKRWPLPIGESTNSQIQFLIP